MPFFSRRGSSDGDFIPPDYAEQFIRNMQAIEAHTKAIANVFDNPAEFAKKIGDAYDPNRPVGKASRPGPTTTENTPGTPLWSTLGTTTEAEVRKVLQGQAPRTRPADRYEAEVEGPASPTGTRVSDNWVSRATPGLGGILPLPRYPGAEPNAQDLLNYLGSVSANLAYKRQVKLNQRGSAAQQQVLQDALSHPRYAGQIDLDQNGAPIGDLPPSVQAQYDAAASSETRLGRVSDLFSTAESAYTQGRYVKGILSRVTRPLSGMAQTGYLTGANSAGSTLFGIRAPWDPAVLQGLSQDAAKWKFALNNNVSPGQAGTIFGNLYQQGWLGGQQTNDMRAAAGQMMQKNPYIASMPQYYQLMDQATRQGASSLSHFNEVMKQIPDSAKAAHVSIAQTIADMGSMAQYNKSIGGTAIQGMANAVQWQGVTGLPSGIMQTLMQNPMVQGQMFMRTGLMPWEQGLASGGQQMSGIFGAVNTLGRMINSPGNIREQVGKSGFYNTISGQDQKEALMSHMLGVDKATVHTMLTNQKGWQAGSQVWQESSDYAQMVRNAVRSGQNPMQILSGAGPGHWGQLKQDLSVAVDAQGHKMFTKAQIRELQNINEGQGKPGHWVNDPSPYRGSRGGRIRHWVPSTIGKSAADIAQHRADRIQQIISQDKGRQQSSTGPRLTIELGPAAKKAFHLSDPTNQYKNANNAGSADYSMNPYAQGPTANPFPDLNVPGSGSYNYGSQYDTGSY